MQKRTRQENGMVLPLLLFALVLVMLPYPASADMTSSQDTYTTIKCGLPGQIIEAGETAAFELTVTNTGQENNRKLWYETFDGKKYDWEIQFMDGETEVNKISIPTGESRKLRLEVDTSSDTPAGEYSVRLHIGDGWYWVYVTISKSHAGELGTLEMTVADKDGEKVKGATIFVTRKGEHVPFDQVMSTADGSVSAELPPGKFDLLITKTGYKDVEKNDVKIKGGITTKTGTVMLDKALFAADTTIKSPSITVSTGENPKYELVLKNVGKSDDTYRLDVEGAPEGWYVRYRESTTSSADISEVFVKSGEEKTLIIEAIPPYGVSTGDYNLTALIDSSQTTYSENLTAKIRGSYDLRVYASQYQYDVNKGDSLTFDLVLTNAGTAGALTNVGVTISAPDGWSADVDPKTIAGIQPGERKPVKLRIVPPANIVASEYKIEVKVKSDQTEKSDAFRVAVREQSLVAVFGLAMILVLAGGVYYMFRKYQRR